MTVVKDKLGSIGASVRGIVKTHFTLSLAPVDLLLFTGECSRFNTYKIKCMLCVVFSWVTWCSW